MHNYAVQIPLHCAADITRGTTIWVIFVAVVFVKGGTTAINHAYHSYADADVIRALQEEGTENGLNGEFCGCFRVKKIRKNSIERVNKANFNEVNVITSRRNLQRYKARCSSDNGGLHTAGGAFFCHVHRQLFVGHCAAKHSTVRCACGECTNVNKHLICSRNCVW